MPVFYRENLTYFFGDTLLIEKDDGNFSKIQVTSKHSIYQLMQLTQQKHMVLTCDANKYDNPNPNTAWTDKFNTEFNSKNRVILFLTFRYVENIKLHAIFVENLKYRFDKRN